MSDLSADPETIRTALHKARAEVEELRARGAGLRPQLEPAAAGTGFADKGQALAASLNRVHEAMLTRLDNRLVHFAALESLTSSIVDRDGSTAEELQHHELR